MEQRGAALREGVAASVVDARELVPVKDPHAAAERLAHQVVEVARHADDQLWLQPLECPEVALGAGDLAATLAVANSPDGGAYPSGSVVQLVPTEVMVKHPEGTSPATKDWEFFELTVSPEGSTIAKRGFVDVNNRFGGNCLGCHAKAKPQWDMICETGHGCDPIPLTKAMVSVIQKTDPRCESMPVLSAEEKQLLGQLQQLLR